MKVLHVAEVMQGGIATYLNEMLARHLIHSPGDQLLLICPAEHLPYLEPALRDAVEIRPYTRTGRNLGSLLRLWKFFRRTVRQWRPDLVHAHSSFAGGVCRLPYPGKSAPVVYCAHGWAFDQELHRYKQYLYAGLERLLAPRASQIIAISEHEKASAVRIGIPASRIAVVRYGLDTGRVLNDERHARESGPLCLLFVGRFDRQKGLDWLLEVMSHLSPDQVRLRLAGSPVLSKTASQSLPPGVTSLGWISSNELDQHIDTADAVIMPSRWEGFGLVAVEAMRRAVPVLVSDRGALAEVVGDGGIVFRLDAPEELVSMLPQLDRKALLEMGRRGRARFIQHFTASRMTDETLAIYRLALAPSIG